MWQQTAGKAILHGRIGLIALLPVLAAWPTTASAISRGESHETVRVMGVEIAVYTYRPKCEDPALLIVLHGSGRDAEKAGKSARRLANRLCFIVLAPEFDKERFSNTSYWLGGIASKRTVRDPRLWTGNLVLALVDWARMQERKPLDYYLIGHSAGGQFLSRLAAYVPHEAKRIVIANPSTYVLPDLDANVPFGFGGMYSTRAEAEAQLRHYLAQPVTIFLGQEDHGLSRKYQRRAGDIGDSRHERGLTVFGMAKQLAASRRWNFNWSLVEVPGVAHSSRKMYSSAEAQAALSRPPVFRRGPDAAGAPPADASARPARLQPDVSGEPSPASSAAPR
jgi:predicted esterase